MNVAKGLIAGCFLLIGASALATDEFTSLEERMSLDEFRAAGLEKLSSEELQRLNEWLRQNDVVQAAAPAPAPAPQQDRVAQGFRPVAAERSVVTSRIDGEFTGWRGRTVFKLQNGQVWRQTDSKTFRYNATDPEIRIEPKALGVWKLYVDGLNRGVKVVRIE